MGDMTCLAKDLVYPADFEKTGVNLNEIIVGPTGCGKTFSNAYSRLLHTWDSSVIVPISKKALKKKFETEFQKKGYQVQCLDFSCPEACEMGYDPLDFIHRDEDVIQLARNLIGVGISKTQGGEADPYWNDSATSVLAAEIALVRMKAKAFEEKPKFSNVIKLHRSLKIINEDGLVKTSLDKIFQNMGEYHPGNQASELWKTIQNLAARTASCIISIVNNALDKIFTESVLEIVEKENKVSFAKMGEEKTALFIVTSPMNRSLQTFINVMYADMFRDLFESAAKNEEECLKIPVHIICDDFACGGRIQGFEDYISIFRAAGISVTLLIQSESQLASMYGKDAAVTIINNCDTYVYMGGMDVETCRNVSLRSNKPLDKIMNMELERVVVFRRGQKPVFSYRYPTTQDVLYKEMMGETTSACEQDRG